MKNMNRIVIGTRPSALALGQCSLVAQTLWSKTSIDVTFAVYRTSGDRAQETSGAASVSKRAWVDDLEKALVTGAVDIVVHSSKDLPTELAMGTCATSVLPRAAPNDVLVLRGTAESPRSTKEVLEGLPPGARVGTASARRRTQLLRLNPNLVVVEHRGNVPTRLRKMYNANDLDAIVLAEAGLVRLGYEHVQRFPIDVSDMVPASGQGTLVAQYREGDEAIRLTVQSLVDGSTDACWRAERAFLTHVGADCRSALGVFAEIKGDSIAISYIAISHDGRDAVSGTCLGDLTCPEDLARIAASKAFDEGIGNLLR